MRVDLAQFKNFLLDSRLITELAWDEAEEEANQRHLPIKDVLVANGIVTDDDLRRIESHVLGIPFVNLKTQKIDPKILALIPEPIARKHNIIAFKKSDSLLEVAMLDTADLEAIEFIRKGVGLKIAARLTDTESMKAVLVQYQKSLKDDFGEILARETAALQTKTAADGDIAPQDLAKMATEVPVVRIVDALLTHAILQKASDIHIEPFETELVIRYRIDGILHDAMILAKNTIAGITARLKVLASLRLDEKRLPQDGRFKIEAAGQKVSFRVSILPTAFGEKIVLRLLPDAVKGLTLEAAGFSHQGLELIHGALKHTTGMILITGPTGSGKTTTLYTMMDILNTPDVNISTIEDPIEYQMPRINQTQVKSEIGLTFAAGLRSLVRQDPDIIMVGEIRDKETVSLAINASLTGHLVLSTLHTNSAAGAVPRLLDMGAEAFLLVSTINLVIAQRLVRQLIDKKNPYHLSKDQLAMLGSHVDLDRLLGLMKQQQVVAETDDWSTINFYRPTVEADSADGYRGRVAIYEVLKPSRVVHDLISKQATSEEIEDQAKKEGMVTMLEDGIMKAAQGLTTIEEVLRVIIE